MDYLDKNKEVVLVGLNPTEQAKKHHAVFCQTVGLWNIISMSELFKLTGLIDIKKIPLGEGDGKYKHYAVAFFGEQSLLGFCDLAPHVYAKNSKDVKVSQQQKDDLWSKLANTNVKKVGLLGKRVTKELFPELRESKFNYGKLEVTKQIGKNQVIVYCIPFPETVPIKTEIKLALYNTLTLI